MSFKLPEYVAPVKSMPVKPGQEQDLIPPAAEEISALLNTGETLVGAYAGRIDDVEGRVVHVTLVNRLQQYSHIVYDFKAFHPENPRPDLYFVSVTAKHLDRFGKQKHITRFKFEKPVETDGWRV